MGICNAVKCQLDVFKLLPILKLSLLISGRNLVYLPIKSPRLEGTNDLLYTKLKHCTLQCSYYYDGSAVTKWAHFSCRGRAAYSPWGPYSWGPLPQDFVQFKPVFTIISLKLLMYSTHKKCFPEWISGEENKGKSLGEMEGIKSKYSSNAHSNQGEQDLTACEKRNGCMHRLRFPGHPAKLMSPFPPPECLPCPFTSLSQSFRGPIFLSSLHLPGPSGSNPSLHMLFPDIIHLSYIRLIASFLRTDYKLFSIFSPAIVPTFCYYPHPVFSTFNMCFWN